MKYILVFIFSIWAIALPAQKDIYIGEQVPQGEAVMFAPHIISTALNERDLAISPDGKEVFYSLVLSRKSAILVYRKFENNVWTPPQTVAFSGKAYDIEPAFSPDGKRLYFVSNRTLDQSTTKKDFDIWYATRKADNTWDTPQNIGLPINTSVDEFYPSIAQNGTLYFTAKYGESENIWYATLENGKYQKPIPLPEAINTDKDEFNAFVSLDEQYIFFSSYGRADDMGGGDLYMSAKDEKGNWQPAKNLQSLNSNRLDYCPSLSPDGKYLFYTTQKKLQNPTPNNPFQVQALLKRFLTGGNGGGDIYWISLQELLKKP